MGFRSGKKEETDVAGANESKEWLNSFPNAKRCPVPEGKCRDEFFSAGGDIWLWVKNGLCEETGDSCMDFSGPGGGGETEVIRALKAILEL